MSPAIAASNGDSTANAKPAPATSTTRFRTSPAAGNRSACRQITGKSPDSLDLASRWLAPEQFRNNLHVQPQSPRLAQHLQCQAPVVRRRQNHLVHKSRARQPSQIAHPPDHAVRRAALVVQKPIHPSSRFGMLLHVGRHAPVPLPPAPTISTLRTFTGLLRAMVLPRALPPPGPERAKMQQAGATEQTACRPRSPLQAVSEAQQRRRPQHRLAQNACLLPQIAASGVQPFGVAHQSDQRRMQQRDTQQGSRRSGRIAEHPHMREQHSQRHQQCPDQQPIQPHQREIGRHRAHPSACHPALQWTRQQQRQCILRLAGRRLELNLRHSFRRNRPDRLNRLLSACHETRESLQESTAPSRLPAVSVAPDLEKVKPLQVTSCSYPRISITRERR